MVPTVNTPPLVPKGIGSPPLVPKSNGSITRGLRDDIFETIFLHCCPVVVLLVISSWKLLEKEIFVFCFHVQIFTFLWDEKEVLGVGGGKKGCSPSFAASLQVFKLSEGN